MTLLSASTSVASSTSASAPASTSSSPQDSPRYLRVSAPLFAKETLGAGGVNEWPATIAVQQAATQTQHSSQAGGPGFDAKRARAAGEPLGHASRLRAYRLLLSTRKSYAPGLASPISGSLFHECRRRRASRAFPHANARRDRDPGGLSCGILAELARLLDDVGEPLAKLEFDGDVIGMRQQANGTARLRSRSSPT